MEGTIFVADLGLTYSIYEFTSFPPQIITCPERSNARFILRKLRFKVNNLKINKSLSVLI